MVSTYLVNSFFYLHVGAPAPVKNSAPPSVPVGNVVVQSQSSTTSTAANTPTGGPAPPFVSGDRVRVQLEVEIFKMMQEGHGGWSDDMCEVVV